MKKNLTFEAAMERLEKVVAQLDAGEATLDESLKLFAEGAQLLAFCNNALEKAELTLQQVFPAEKQDDSGDEE